MHKKLGARGGGDTKYRKKNDESSAKPKNKEQPIVRDTEKAKQKKTLSEKLPLFFFFSVCVCVCNFVSSMRREWQHLPLFTTYSTNNEQSWGVPPRCVRVYNKCEKKREMVVVFLLSLPSTWQAHAHYSSFCFLLLVHLIHFILFSVLLFFFLQVCAEKHCSGSYLVVMQF